MATANPTLTKRYLAGGNIFQYRIVKPGSNNDDVVLATASSSVLLGVVGAEDGALDASPMVVDNDQVDVHVAGIVLVKCGGTITRGDRLTSDATGKAVTTTTGGHRVIGTALHSGVLFDLIPVLLGQGTL
jgi:hypothetical protein